MDAPNPGSRGLMNGVLVIDKPAGPTSFDVVRRVRTLLRVEKAGHTGTLDPSATGVLPICLGTATRVAGLMSEGRKSYHAAIRLGIETDTQDAAGSPLRTAPVPPLSAAVLEGALAKFRGASLQVPPMYSAVKIGGKRLYELARAGMEIHREPRSVAVAELSLLDFSSTELAVSITCSKGFFVRALAHDLGRELGCGAHLKTLRRTASGPFTLRDASALEELIERVRDAKLGLEQISQLLVPIGEALRDLPEIRIAQSDAQRVAHGVPIEWSSGKGKVRVVGPDGRLLAIAELGTGPRLKYVRVLV